MKEKFKQTLSRASEVVFRYPFVLLMAILASAGTILMFENNNRDEVSFNYSKYTICFCIGISLMFGIKMLSQRIGKSVLLHSVGILFLLGFYFILPRREDDFTEVYGYIIAVTVLLTHLLVSFGPFFGNTKELQFWQYNKNLFVNIVLTAIFTGVLTAGVELAILAVDKLFEFNFGDSLYTDTLYVLIIFGSCFVFLLFNEKGLDTLEKDGEYPVILKFFTQFILIPLLLIYVVILYFYSVKILINWELPRGWVSYLVLAYSIVGVLALLLVHPLKEDHTKSWVKIFSKAFYYTIIPLIILLFTAIFTRILEYGYTEPRYFVLALALWILCLVIYFIINKKSTIKFIPVSLFVFGIFTLIFPYFNAFSVSNRSQKNELLKLLHEKQLLVNNTINFQKKITDTVANEIGDKFEFLGERRQTEFLLHLIDAKKHRVLADDIKLSSFSGLKYSIQNEFINVSKTKGSDFERLTLTSEKSFISLDGYEYMIGLDSFENDAESNISGDRFQVQEKAPGAHLKVTLNNNEEADFSNDIDALMNRYKNKTGNIKLPEVTLEKELGNYQLKLIFRNITREKNAYGTENTYYDHGFLLIKKK